MKDDGSLERMDEEENETLPPAVNLLQFQEQREAECVNVG